MWTKKNPSPVKMVLTAAIALIATFAACSPSSGPDSSAKAPPGPSSSEKAPPGPSSSEKTPGKPNSFEEALVGRWTTKDELIHPEFLLLASEFSFRDDHTFAFIKTGRKAGAELESNATGTWTATANVVCIRFVSCTGSGCAALQDLPAGKLPFEACTQYALSDQGLGIHSEAGFHPHIRQ